MRYGSVCSGIESASVAWESLGWSPAWFSEIEAFPSAVLAYRWPHVTNLGDMCKLPAMLDIGLIEAPDVLVGGTPCQAFSVAGMRGGLTDDRGLLTLKYIEVANAIDRQRGGGDECIVVWENVPGVLSSKDNAFGHFLAGLVGEEEPLRPPGGRWLNTGCVYGPQRQAAWRILDAQYFGVAQRRRRVFVVASGRDGFSPAKVLFEFEGVRRDTPPSRETGQGVARGAAVCTGNGYWREADGLAAPIRAQDSQKDSTVLVCHGTQDPCVSDKAFALGRNGGKENVLAAFSAGQTEKAGSIRYRPEQSPTLRGGASGTNQVPTLHSGLSVRRFTPRECERLQGFPDDYTLIPWRGKPAEDCPDGPRYKAIGNSKARPVIKWIGERINAQTIKTQD